MVVNMFDSGENQQVHVSQERVLASPSRFIDVTDGDLLEYFIGRYIDSHDKHVGNILLGVDSHAQVNPMRVHHVCRVFAE